jgi:hypothetical protein
VDAGELPGEVHRVVVAGLAGHGGDGQISPVEELAGPRHPQLHLELQRSDAEPFAEEGVELGRTQPDHRGQGRDGSAMRHRRPQMLRGPFERAQAGAGLAPPGGDHLCERVPGGPGGPDERRGGEPGVERVDGLRDQARHRRRVAQVRDRSADRRVRGPDEVRGIGPGEVEPPQCPRIILGRTVSVRPVGREQHSAAAGHGHPGVPGAAPPGAVGADQKHVLARAARAPAPMPRRVREVPGIGDQQLPGHRVLQRLSDHRARHDEHPLPREALADRLPIGRCFVHAHH